MYRVLPIAGVVAVCLGLTGCAGTLDTVTSRRFRQEPFNTTYRMIRPEDPLVVLRADPPRSGDDRAKAMLRLKEPLENNLSQADQDGVVDLLAKTATADPSPVLRMAAVDALGRFRDPRVPGVLMLAYQNASGQAEAAALPLARPAVRTPLAVPTGFDPEVAATLRCRIVEGIGQAGRPETIPFLASVAAGQLQEAPVEDPVIRTVGARGEPGLPTRVDTGGSFDQRVRLAAVRGLSRCRHPDAAAALAQVLAADAGRDPAVRDRAHEGLVALTGRRLPPDPAQWNQVVQAGVTIAPEPGLAERTVEQAAAWIKTVGSYNPLAGFWHGR